jgi:ATP-dependent metalloprotease FtsH
MADIKSNKKTNKKLPGDGDQGSQNRKPKFNVTWIYVLIILAFLSMWLFNTGSGTIETNQKYFESEMLAAGDVEKIVIVNERIVEIYIKEDRLDKPKYKEVSERGFSKFSRSGPHYSFTIPSVDHFLEQLDKVQENLPESKRIYVESATRKDFGEMFGWLILPLLLIVLWLVIFRRMSGGSGGGASNIFNVGKSKARIFDKDTNVKINFNDVAGLEEAKMEIKEIVDFLKNPKKYTNLGGKIPKGALLIGPPGTGKTLLARAVAGEAHVPFFSMSGSDFVEMFVGVGASRVRDLFKQAKEKAPCIVFIDEIDAVGRARGRNPNFGANDERENTLNQLLTEMDGFASNAGVIILAATNRADILDRALLRAGRFDRQIHVELPDLNERREIFEVHLKPLRIEKGLDLEFLAKQTPGFSGADIANVCNESALIAARKNKKYVQRQDFLDAIDRIIGGLEKKNKIITIEEKRTIAFHEAGHATVSWLLEHANPLVKVTIIPRGKALGAAWYLPEERQITNKDQLLDEMCSALGGRASEEINFGKVSTGALNDLERVTKQAYAMVTYFGLSDEIGNLSFYDSSGQSEYSFTKPYSEKTAEQIDKEVKKIVEEQYQRAIKVLKEHKGGLTKIGELLLEKEVLFSEDLEKIFGKRPQKEKEMLIKSSNHTKPKKRSNNIRKETKRKTSSESGKSSKKPQAVKKSA